MKEVVILVGMQGAGKTHYCEHYLPAHMRICQDEGPREFDRLFRRYERAVEEGVERIVIDRTNPTRTKREQFARAGRAGGYRVRIVYFDVPREICERRITDRRNHPTLSVEKMHQAIGAYMFRLEVPAEEECDELVVIRPEGGEA